MFDKILVCYDGSAESDNAIKISEFLARKYRSTVNAIYVVPDFTSFMDAVSADDKKSFSSWIENNLVKKQTDKLDSISRELAKRRVKFSYEILSGLPYAEINKYVRKNQIGLVILGKGRFNKNNILGGTALKMLRNSDIPVMITGKSIGPEFMKNILVPTDIYNTTKSDIEYATGLSGRLKSRVHLFNVVETGDHNIPAEVVESMKGSSYNSLAEMIILQSLGKRFKPVVRVSKNAWMGINDYIKDNNIDFVVLSTYGGKKIRTEYIGSIAAKVIENSPCPVMAIPGK